MKSIQLQNDNAADIAATGEKEKREHKFLTVLEVAALLQVPVSWVYGRLRERSTEPLPGYRVGKYWRFREPEIVAWVKSHRRGSHAA
jgi:excisionase family DNA binding protein